MPIEIKMPALSPTMETGNLAKWHVKEGDTIEPGDVIAEIETDKATMEVESADEGVISKIVIPEGTDEVPVGDVIAILLEEGEDASAATTPAKPKPAKPIAPEPEVKPSAPEAPKPTSATAPVSGGRLKASPLARRIATEKGIEISSLQGTGPGGRIVKADVEAGKAKPVLPAAPAIEVPAFALARTLKRGSYQCQLKLKCRR